LPAAAALQIVYAGVEQGYDPLAEKSRMLAGKRAERQAAALPEPNRSASDTVVDENGDLMDML
jgi:hypothetical protein